MLTENNLSIKGSFNIWFNREKRKEFYTSSIIMYKTIFNHKHSNRFSNIIINLDKPTDTIYFSTSNFNQPFEENYGTFLIRFINADFSTFKSAYFTFFCFYGFSILQEFYENIPENHSYETEDTFINTYEPIFIDIKNKLKDLQNKIRRCINYMYNLKNNLNDSNFSPFEKYLTFIIKNNFFKYSKNIEVFYFQQFAYNTFDIKSQSITPKIIKEHLENEIININDSAIFHTKFLSNIIYVSLAEIASNTNIKIKTCKNCGKYFIPIKNTEKYCDIIYYQDEETCKMNGANNSYSKKRKSVEGIKFYRNNYQRRLMQTKRSDDKQLKLAFENWKKLARNKIKKFNNDEISTDELLEWMKRNKDT